VEEVAKKKGISMAQVAIAWCLSKEGKCLCLLSSNPGANEIRFLGVTAPIIGTTSMKHLKDTIGMLVPHPPFHVLTCVIVFVAAVHVKLTEDEIKLLEEPYDSQNVLGHI